MGVRGGACSGPRASMKGEAERSVRKDGRGRHARLTGRRCVCPGRRRYPHAYPTQAVSIKLKNPDGLHPAVCRQLLEQLSASATAHAEGEEVGVGTPRPPTVQPPTPTQLLIQP